MVGGGDGVVSDICVLILDHFIDKLRLTVVIFILFGWMSRTGLTRLTMDVSLGCAIELLNEIRVNPFTIVFVVNTQLGLPKKT